MLEVALKQEFDPDRVSRAWVRLPTNMDREDFVDLNKVSKQVLGKTPAEVRFAVQSSVF